MKTQNVMAVSVEKDKFEIPMRISNSNDSTKEDVQTKAPENSNNGKNSKKNGSNKKNDTNQEQTDLANRPATPIVYESIDIERPVVQTVAKRENRPSRRINKQKQSTEPKISQKQDGNQAQNSETIQVPDREQATNTPPVVIEDGKLNIPTNATKQAATISRPPNSDNISSNDDMNAAPAAPAAPEMTYFAKKRSTTEILGDSMVKGIQGFKMKEAVRHKENVFVRSFPGANIDAMNYYEKVTKPNYTTLRNE